MFELYLFLVYLTWLSIVPVVTSDNITQLKPKRLHIALVNVYFFDRVDLPGVCLAMYSFSQSSRMSSGNLVDLLVFSESWDEVDCFKLMADLGHQGVHPLSLKREELLKRVHILGIITTLWPDNFGKKACCDLRPLYGIVFAKELVRYDWWGYCDLDGI